jgi:nicotinate-nucleotide adenylyltransferase
LTAVIGLFGGAFDPPHRGHVELARRAKEQFGIDKLLVLVAAAPGHKDVPTPAGVRLRLAQAAFPGDEVVLDDHARTIDMLEAHPEWDDPLFLIGADEFCDFLTWKRPDDVLARTRLAVATRPGFPRERLEAVLGRLDHPDRVLFFDIEPQPVASRDLRKRLEAGEDVGLDVPSAVAAMIDGEMLYGRGTGVH